MNQQLTELHHVLQLIDCEFEYVNHGGCAVIAMHLSEQLRHVFPIMRITSSNSSYRKQNLNIDTIREQMTDSLNIVEWGTNNMHFQHVWVEIFVNKRWYAIDSNGVKPIKAMYKRWNIPAKGSFTFVEIRSLAETDDWNSMFNRDQMPDIAIFIAKHLGVYNAKTY